MTNHNSFKLIQPPEQFLVLGVPVDLLPNYTTWLTDQLIDKQSLHVVTLNAEMVIQSIKNPQLKSIIDEAELVIPDGAGIVLYGKLFGQTIRRCPGIELAEELIRFCGSSSMDGDRQPSLFFYGGAPGIADKAAAKWMVRSPNLRILGVENGYLSTDDQLRLKTKLMEQQPSLILVGLGVPRQEIWIKQNRHLCPNSLWVGVGGSFDIWAGAKRRSPQWMGDFHIEWVYRLIQEPWRWRRMMVLPEFAIKALMEWLTKK